ncbi:unnamed protein product [Brassica napus]|uniref:(rape) hypothetical protein n=1 Tax=Brassica napus TaxID=3708 RepID=A0A816J239_BRANA|nr:unnamed protein product [Brassica napus]
MSSTISTSLSSSRGAECNIGRILGKTACREQHVPSRRVKTLRTISKLRTRSVVTSTQV